MKKLIVATAIAVFAGAGIMLYGNKDGDSALSPLQMENIEALSTTEGTSNTGPALIVDCPGWFTGDAKYCMCENTAPCTEDKCR